MKYLQHPKSSSIYDWIDTNSCAYTTHSCNDVYGFGNSKFSYYKTKLYYDSVFRHLIKFVRCFQ